MTPPKKAVSYFNRAKAPELLEFFEKTYPNSAHLPRMQFQALEALKAYGRWETLAQRGTAFMDRIPGLRDAFGRDSGGGCVREPEKRSRGVQGL